MIIRRGKLWKKIESLYRPARYPLPVVVAPVCLIENYKAMKRTEEEAFRAKLARCSTLSQTITLAVCREFNLTREELILSQRKHALPRQVAMHLVCKHSGKNIVSVARVFKKDHTSIILANRKVPQLARNENHLAQRIRAIETYLAS